MNESFRTILWANLIQSNLWMVLAGFINQFKWFVEKYLTKSIQATHFILLMEYCSINYKLFIQIHQIQILVIFLQNILPILNWSLSSNRLRSTLTVLCSLWKHLRISVHANALMIAGGFSCFVRLSSPEYKSTPSQAHCGRYLLPGNRTGPFITLIYTAHSSIHWLLFPGDISRELIDVFLLNAFT